MKQEILVAGFGGQGILLLGQLLTESAMRQGLYATWFPSYGPEMRGGTANCTTIYADDEIGSPIASLYDTVIAMNQPSMEKFAPRVRLGGMLLVNATMVPTRCQRTDIDIIYVPTGELAKAAGNEKAGNVIMLGVYLATHPELEADTVEQTLRSVIGAKKPDLVDVNIAALHAGLEFAGQQHVAT